MAGHLPALSAVLVSAPLATVVLTTPAVAALLALAVGFPPSSPRSPHSPLG